MLVLGDLAGNELPDGRTFRLTTAYARTQQGETQRLDERRDSATISHRMCDALVGIVLMRLPTSWAY